MPNPTATAASTDTAYNGGAVQDRRPLAYAARVNLSEHVRFVQASGGAVNSGLIVKPGVSEPVDRFAGFIFSAACTEVEIDVLTSETTILGPPMPRQVSAQSDERFAIVCLSRHKDRKWRASHAPRSSAEFPTLRGGDSPEASGS
ncbi:hypothetical protein LRS73_34165 (plasmid) [Methylobacterium currus]|uniref:hypothetical protein n=1 Tax=Methylobacterium currus TaxID=2051553 RepID=UPI001E28F5DB|nr:hypothetical protein [Methylobacterium currus]UHC20015.1 hypothetical protein LRS73_34165 [Methylobacterium currus]